MAWKDSWLGHLHLLELGLRAFSVFPLQLCFELGFWLVCYSIRLFPGNCGGNILSVRVDFFRMFEDDLRLRFSASSSSTSSFEWVLAGVAL